MQRAPQMRPHSLDTRVMLFLEGRNLRIRFLAVCLHDASDAFSTSACTSFRHENSHQTLPIHRVESGHTSITDAPDVQHSQRTGVPSNPGKLCCSRSSGGWASEWSDSSTGDVKGDDDEKPGSSAVSDSISGGRCRGRGGCGAKQRRGAAREATVHCWVGDGAEVARFTPPGRLRH